MVTDQQVRKLMKLSQTAPSLDIAADKSGMSPRSAQKYRKLKKLPSECKPIHNWKTRLDPFDDVWEEVLSFLGEYSALQGKTNL